MDSTTTTARGTITGSCLPEMVISVLSPFLFTVCWGCEMEGVGLTAARRISLDPSLSPPSVPPEWLVFLETDPFSEKNGSLLLLPEDREAAKPSPISTPLYGADGKDSLCKQRVKFVEDRLAKSGGKPVGNAFDHAAAGISGSHQ